MIDSFSTKAIVVKAIEEFMFQQNKTRNKPMSRSEAIRRLILNGYEWFMDNKILYSARTPEEYHKYQEELITRKKIQSIQSILD